MRYTLDELKAILGEPDREMKMVSPKTAAEGGLLFDMGQPEEERQQSYFWKCSCAAVEPNPGEWRAFNTCEKHASQLQWD